MATHFVYRDRSLLIGSSALLVAMLPALLLQDVMSQTALLIYAAVQPLMIGASLACIALPLLKMLVRSDTRTEGSAQPRPLGGLTVSCLALATIFAAVQFGPATALGQIGLAQDALPVSQATPAAD